MDRRAFAALFGTLLAIPRALYAQPARRIYRIAILDDSDERTREKDRATFKKRLAQLGFAEGGNVTFDVRHANGAPERLPPLAVELVASKPDLIVTPGTSATRAAMRATSSIPIVFIGSGDPVGAGLVTSLARPGGNVTGLSNLAVDTVLKRLELLREIAPGVQRIGYLSDISNPASVLAYTRLEESARKAKISIRLHDGLGQALLERSFAAMRLDRVQALLVGANASLLEQREQIVQFALKERLPAVYGIREFVDAGGLLSYSADRNVVSARGADYVQRILKGAKPADLPVEQIAAFQTVLNLKAARALGIKIPDSVRLRADEVIE